ncbi:DUF805 domain-containing protein [Phenylobacterium sp.]|uniref:DUF805 domain-containing protein n=1 Tax=Phenylobacterium sp. TaxID=1871053 RepID=UPI002D0D55A2|nr:DUF805 domain-containing protein [Phenylobacterium sp.]HLZ74756.1 DUF805 domain-containing protein [Phenylobacterium sp.]
MTNDVRGLADGKAEPKQRGFAKWIAGRGRRREYWAWLVPLLILEIVIGMTGAAAFAQLCGLPMLLAMIRRLHDLGYSGWFAPVINVFVAVMLFAAKGFLPPMAATLAGALISLIAIVGLGALPGEAKRNEYGDPPGRPAGKRLADTFS